MTEKIKYCPYCGEKAEMFIVGIDTKRYRCPKCKAETLFSNPNVWREKIELKPCPFCGSEAEFMPLGVRCKNPDCASIRNVLFPEKAIEAWNKRVQE